MDTILAQKRKEIYSASSDTIKSLYENLELGRITISESERLGLKSDETTILIEIIGDVILNLGKKSDIPKILNQRLHIEITEADKVAYAYESVLKILDEINPQLPEADPTLKEGLDLRPEEGDIIPRGETIIADEADPSARPLTRDELLKALSAKRTMASDIHAVQSSAPQAGGQVQGYEAYRAQVTDDSKE